MPRKKEMIVRKIVSFPEWLLQAVEDYRYDTRIPSEAEAIRTLIEVGLRAEGRKIKRPK